MNKYHVRMEKNTAFLCCGKAGCPSVSKDSEGLVVITDDHGSSVKMSEDEALLIHLAVCAVNDPDHDQTPVETKRENFGIEPKKAE